MPNIVDGSQCRAFGNAGVATRWSQQTWRRFPWGRAVRSLQWFISLSRQWADGPNPKSIPNSLPNKLSQGAVTNQYGCVSLLEFSSELQTLLVKGENCVFDEVFKNITLTLMGLIIWRTIAPKNIHETLIWLLNSTWSFDFVLLEGRCGMQRPPVSG